MSLGQEGESEACRIRHSLVLVVVECPLPVSPSSLVFLGGKRAPSSQKGASPCFAAGSKPHWHLSWKTELSEPTEKSAFLLDSIKSGAQVLLT